MANEKHDPWALLAAARGSVLQHKERLLDCDHDAETCTCDLAAQKIVLLDRIDAALAEGCPDCGHRYGQQEYCQGDGHAEYADSAQSAVESEVEWTQDALGYYARVKVEAEIEVFQDLSGEWQWNRTALSDVRRHGSANTLDEAQRAALAAAREMR